MNISEALSWRKLLYKSLIMVLTVLAATGCSTDEPSPAPTEPLASAEHHPARDWLSKAQEAAQGMNRYAFVLQLTQELTGTEEAEHSKVSIDMQGRVERNPLKLDQTINSHIDGEASTLRSILVPDAYYMYLPEYEEWNKLSKEIVEENKKTLSDFQVDPPKALKEIQALGDSLQAEQVGDLVTIRYEGAGAAAQKYLAGILASTMGLSSSEGDILNRLEVSSLNIMLTLDADKHWPLSFRIESDMGIEFEPGQSSRVTQTLAGTYNKHNSSSSVTVPKEAQEAIDPEEMERELERGLNPD